MQSTLPHLQNQSNKKAKYDFSKRKIFAGGFWFSLTKTDSKVLWLSLMNEKPPPAYSFLNWSYFSHIYLKMPFFL